jgi:hypothetical protein
MITCLRAIVASRGTSSPHISFQHHTSSSHIRCCTRDVSRVSVETDKHYGHREIQYVRLCIFFTNVRMDQQEVLVHVTAPSRLRDDRRYQSVADQLRKFEVATVTRVYTFVGLVSKFNDLKPSAEANVSFYEVALSRPAPRSQQTGSIRGAADFDVEVWRTSTTIESTVPCIEPDRHPDRTWLGSFVNETPARRTTRAASLEPYIDQQTGLKAKCLGQWQVMKSRHSIETPRARTTSNNPAYKNPFHGTKISPGAIALGLQTPRMVHPRTAPTGSTGTIQVAGTMIASHKRPASDSMIDDSFATTGIVSDSQFPLIRAAHVAYDPEQRQRHRAHTKPTEAAGKIDAQSDIQPAKRRRLTLSENLHSVMADTARISGAVQAKGTLATDYLVRPPLGCQGPYFLRNRSEDWTSPPETSTSDPSSNTLSSTLSPSQPLALRLSQTRMPPNSAQPSPPIDLTSTSPSQAHAIQTGGDVQQPSTASRPTTHSSPRVPSDPFNSSPNSATRSFYHNSSPPVRFAGGQNTRSARSSSTEDGRRCNFTSSIKSLPDRIEAPPPPTGTGSFVTHVSRALSIMITRLPLAKHFRPVTVTRDVRVLERGHWSLRVKIASEGEVAEARRPLEKSEIVTAMDEYMAGANSIEREARYASWKVAGEKLSQLGLSKRCDLWTEAEFLHFWESLKNYVEDGKAGHGLSVAKDWAEEAVTPGRSTQSTYARIRIYTWGEVLGHIWIALWVLSDKKTAYIPMEWVSTDDTVVVAMSGNRHKGGRLGPWVPKGSPGGKGSWGVATSTPPSGQGKYARLTRS